MTRARTRRPMAAALVLVALGLSSVLAQQPAGGGTPRLSPPEDLPPGEGVEAVRARCLGCHGSDVIAAQRLSEDGWGREVDKMVRWGARVSADERTAMVAYLARHFTVTPVATPPAQAGGEATFTRACLSCHGRDMTEQQRLSPAGWTREVEKMMRWGARVADSEKDPLVAYLAARYGVRR